MRRKLNRQTRQGAQMSAEIPQRRGTIYIQSRTAGQSPDAMLGGSVIGSNDVSADLHIMSKALEFRNAAPRLRLMLVVDMVPPWKAWICRVLLRMEVGCIRTEKERILRRRISDREWFARPHRERAASYGCDCGGTTGCKGCDGGRAT